MSDLVEKVGKAIADTHSIHSDPIEAHKDYAKAAIAVVLKDIRDWQNKYRIVASNDFVAHYARENGVSLDE